MSQNNKQPSGAGFIAVNKILADLKGRKRIGIAWDIITEETLADIKHKWALLITEVFDEAAKIQTPHVCDDAIDFVADVLCKFAKVDREQLMPSEDNWVKADAARVIEAVKAQPTSPANTSKCNEEIYINQMIEKHADRADMFQASTQVIETRWVNLMRANTSDWQTVRDALELVNNELWHLKKQKVFRDGGSVDKAYSSVKQALAIATRNAKV